VRKFGRTVEKGSFAGKTEFAHPTRLCVDAFGDSANDDVPIGENSDQPPLLDDRQRANVLTFHQLGRLREREHGFCCSRFRRHRITNLLRHLDHLHRLAYAHQQSANDPLAEASARRSRLSLRDRQEALCACL